MAVFPQVKAALEGQPQDWRTELALSIAKDIDDTENPSAVASLARALRTVMADIDAGREPEKEGTVADELKARRAARVAGAKGSKRAARADDGGA